MNEYNSAILAIAARLTSYPSSLFHDELAAIQEFANEELGEGPARSAVLKAASDLESLSLREVREQYVAAFDLKDRTGLYLTAHELGESRKRGVAMLELREFARTHGFEPLDDELPDYLPMLYELAAAVPESNSLQHLMDRLAFATQRIRIHLPDENPYKPIFEALMQSTFNAPTDEMMKERERNREKPDLDPMPYPIMYK